MKKKLSKLLLVSLLTVSVAAPVSASASASASTSKVEITRMCSFMGNLCSLIK